MNAATLETEVLTYFQRLPLAQKYAVLAFVRMLVTPVGSPGCSLLTFAGRLSASEAQAMQQAIASD